ncbi:vicilin-like seed storage protein [Gossypium australe]|uniref:Vicilin-like seed storage protein n=1 Tax=Gossypium australe TaxID=47621 RepID=A0A5B6WT95_9ROSI|nr:vicilin-like seed storage protein [Gossypium australe]
MYIFLSIDSEKSQISEEGALINKIPSMAGVSLKCGDCGALLKSVEEAQEHAELTSHSNFSESTEAVLNLVCSSCGKPCRSKVESDLHTKRTGHTEFIDKTLEAAIPISLEVPKVAKESEEAIAAGSTSEPEASGLWDENLT